MSRSLVLYSSFLASHTCTNELYSASNTYRLHGLAQEKIGGIGEKILKKSLAENTENTE